MSEKQQHTAAHMREKMLSRYGDELHHKHDKFHNPYRQHCRSHPNKSFQSWDNEDQNVHHSTGLLHVLRRRKLRKRLDRGYVH